MDYGKSIREARKKLDLTQQELVDDNLSRNLLSNIEVGKTKLVPQKALALYLRILEISWTKSIKIDIEFDELLENDVNYKAYKKANFLCGVLKDYLDNDINISYEELVQISDFSRKNNVGLLSFFLHLYAARNYVRIGYDKIALNSYVNAVDYIKRTKEKVICLLFNSTLKEAISLFYKFEEFDLLVNYHEILEELEPEVFGEVGLFTLYNLGLFYRRQGNFEKSLDRINKFLERMNRDTKIDYLDALIVKATALTGNKQVGYGIEIYKEIINIAKEEDKFIEQYTMAISNIIYTISKNNMTEHLTSLKKYIEDLLFIIDKSSDSVLLQKSYSSLAQGYRLLGNLEQSKFYFEKSYSSLEDEYVHTNDITILEESYETYLQLNDLEILIPRITKINYSELNITNRNRMLLIIIKLQQVFADYELNNVFYTQLNEYINNITK